MYPVNNFKVSYHLPPVQGRMVPYAFWDDAFNENELNWLQAQAAAASEVAAVGRQEDLPPGETGVVKDLRRTLISWMRLDVTNEWVYAKLAYAAQNLNISYFNLDLTGFVEPLQMTNYLADDRGTYDWHIDYGSFICRKLTVIVQLSDPSSFEGGDLQLQNGGGIITIEKKRGRIIAFPSYCLHQVTPVTKGSRQTLVSWISGPAIR
ncbi:Oxoglutarate/iron-dependent dioxygenase [uncultured Caudovirales phage]|uniref:Oxoglutarate/iron-dependent dioxygenase n=1 Tax=uncultured Caudovirales phage TaxID=2100421 RepID=A0A6J7X3T2_9CAUD|nr:Oxoglutarate/iron-dependent dioxygenase [uncultured Caudovirales phage]